MVKIVSLNVRGLANEKKRRIIFNECRKRGDICVLQETHSTEVDQQYWTSEWGGKIIFSHGKNDARGVCVMFHRNLNYRVFKTKCETSGRYIILEVKIDDIILVVANVYAPNRDTPSFFTEIAAELRNFGENKIIVGDLNLTLDVHLDRLNTYQNNNNSKQVLEKCMEEFYLRDIWRDRNEDVRAYTWFKSTRGEETKASRLDYALIEAGLDVENITFFPASFTDHRAIFVTIKTIHGIDRGKGYWKFNNTLLKNIEFVNCINNKISQELSDLEAQDPVNKWVQLKIKIAKHCQNFARKNKAEETVAISQLLEKIDDMQQNFPLNSSENELYQKTKTDLEEIQMNYIQGVMFRSKAKWFAEGERNSKYFFSLEKTKYNAKVCNRLLSDNEEITNHEQIVQKQVEFYATLYRADPTITFELQNEENIKVDNVISDEFYSYEVTEALKMLNNDKTPGPDGLSADFYKVFWGLLKEPFFEMLRAARNQNKIHKNMKEGILNLIPKANKDPRLLKNLRPITILNTDYKLIEKCISNRIKPCLSHIIHNDQTGFMSNRRISTNIRKIFDVMYASQERDESNIVLSCDFVKCFDRCEFQCITGALKYFDFPQVIIDWVVYNALY